jgi:hypothetical protein
MPRSRRIRPSLSIRRPRRLPPNSAEPTPTTTTLPSPACTSARFADSLYTLCRHETLDLHSRSASTTCPFKRTRVRPLAATRPLFEHDLGITVAAQHAHRYKTTALHFYTRRYTSPRHQTFYARSAPLLLQPPNNRGALAAGNASDLASSFRRATYITGRLTRKAYAAGVTHQVRAPNVLCDTHTRTNLLAKLVYYTCKHTQPLQLGHRQLVPGERLQNALTRFSPTTGPTAHAILYSHNSRPTPEPNLDSKNVHFAPNPPMHIPPLTPSPTSQLPHHNMSASLSFRALFSPEFYVHAFSTTTGAKR